MTYAQQKAITQLTRCDAEYQRIRNECEALEAEYGRILTKLDDSDRLLLERYFALCEEMDYRQLCIALEMNKAALD